MDNAFEILFREYELNRSSDTDEFFSALHYFSAGLKYIADEDTVGTYLCDAVSAENRQAFYAGIKAGIQLLMGGNGNE